MSPTVETMRLVYLIDTQIYWGFPKGLSSLEVSLHLIRNKTYEYLCAAYPRQI